MNPVNCWPVQSEYQQMFASEKKTLHFNSFIYQLLSRFTIKRKRLEQVHSKRDILIDQTLMIQQLMKYLFGLGIIALIAFAVVPTHSVHAFTNTTDFWNTFFTDYKLGYQSYAGYEDIDWYYPQSSASMYYSFWQGFDENLADKTVPLIIWLQGGPGASSQFGCFNQVGPLYIEGKKGTYKPTENPWSWTFFGHLMCIDQPIGVGFSYNNNTAKVDTTQTATKHFINFLYNFFKNNPKLNLKENPLYIAGESYAGHYIPAFAQAIKINESLGFNLQGVMIGDGLVDAEYQFNNFDSYLSAAGIVSSEWRDTTTFMQNEALTRIMHGDLKEATDYINFIINNDDIANKYYAGMNVMNYKQYDAGNINPEYGGFIQEKKKNFGVPDWLNYNDDNQEMYAAFSADISKSFKGKLENILERGVKTLIYNGQNDVVINTPGTLAYLNTLSWTGAKQWKSAPKKIFVEGTSNYGWNKKYRNLNFVLVRNAGHLVPADQPQVAWFMLKRYFLGMW